VGAPQSNHGDARYQCDQTPLRRRSPMLAGIVITAVSLAALACSEPIGGATVAPAGSQADTTLQGPTASARIATPIYLSRPRWCLSSPAYCDLLDRVLPIPAPPPGWTNSWHWWATVRILGQEVKFGELVCTFCAPHSGKGEVTLDAAATVSSLDGALIGELLSGVTPDLDRLAKAAHVARVTLTAAEEPNVARLAARLEKFRFPAVRPPVTVVDGLRLELWIDTSSGDSLLVSTTLPPKDLEAWMLELRALVIGKLEKAGGRSVQVDPTP
jgi:hypothetical protein